MSVDTRHRLCRQVQVLSVGSARSFWTALFVLILTTKRDPAARTARETCSAWWFVLSARCAPGLLRAWHGSLPAAQRVPRRNDALAHELLLAHRRLPRAPPERQRAGQRGEHAWVALSGTPGHSVALSTPGHSVDTPWHSAAFRGTHPAIVVEHEVGGDGPSAPPRVPPPPPPPPPMPLPPPPPPPPKSPPPHAPW